ncbi:DUF6879 family protein [Nocardia sp. alder85J]|uniref:DUF6879 family protein n=1 Tax=Nocardia sp. alder85J TaxID=2862949 RepID=UPI001CD27274|nr:DUF6879 family protein [Nocardia sp. alder85J]MCX4098119.1 hypothetical protein [Nocardia sp. alder85J]
MLDDIYRISGEKLLGDVYLSDFDGRFWNIRSHGFWKLERRQHFEEPNDDSWVAFSRGRWDEALELLEDRRPRLRRHYDRLAESNIPTRRVRIVENPVSKYMQWELHLLLIRDELGGSCRVLHTDRVRRYETSNILPELVTLGDDVMYELLYDGDGLQEGGVRYTDRQAVARSREFIMGLYESGEDLASYFRREIAPLPPPDMIRKDE